MYQPSLPYIPKVVYCEGFKWTSTYVPGGASGVALKLKSPQSAGCAERDGFRRDALTILRVNIAWGRSLSHSAIGKAGSQV